MTRLPTPHHRLAVLVRTLAVGLSMGLTLAGCHASNSSTQSPATPETAKSLDFLDLQLDTLDKEIAPAFGTGVPALVEGPLPESADQGWSEPVGAMVASERTLIDFTLMQAMAAKCAFSQDYVSPLQAGTDLLAERELIGLGYRSRYEIQAVRKFVLTHAEARLASVSAADCQAQESRAKATASLAASDVEPPTLDSKQATAALIHRQVLRLAKIEEIATRCAVPESKIQSITEVIQYLQTAASGHISAQTLSQWQKEGGTLAQFAFSAWPSVQCDIVRKVLPAHTAGFEQARIQLKNQQL